MKYFKYLCAAMALGSLAGALIPTSIVPQHTATAPEWVGRAIYTGDFLLLGTVFYGMQKRKPIYWRLIPVLMAIYLLSVAIPTLWTVSRLSLPWFPFIVTFVFIFIGLLFFIAWWRNQKSYFA
jgi:hypothetical protein